jgi:hypothetical protein
MADSNSNKQEENNQTVSYYRSICCVFSMDYFVFRWAWDCPSQVFFEGKKETYASVLLRFCLIKKKKKEEEGFCCN